MSTNGWVEYRERVLAELRETRKRIDTLDQKIDDLQTGPLTEIKIEMAKLGTHKETLDKIDVRLAADEARIQKLESLRDQAKGAQWLANIISGLIGAGGAAALFKFFLQ